MSPSSVSIFLRAKGCTVAEREALASKCQGPQSCFALQYYLTSAVPSLCNSLLWNLGASRRSTVSKAESSSW